MAKPSSNGFEWSTERVACCEDGSLCFQSVTAYGTKHYMMQMRFESALAPVQSKEVITNFDWDCKCSIMIPFDGTPTVTSLKCHSNGNKPHQHVSHMHLDPLSAWCVEQSANAMY